MTAKLPLAETFYTAPLDKTQLPTMYDLPSEDPEEPGLFDEYHSYQTRLLRETFRPTVFSTEQILISTTLYLYYDPYHPLRYKRPDWFVVFGATPSRTVQELRLSYVVWQEEIVPYLIVELLAPDTEHEDLGRNQREVGQELSKWEVYERILRVPYYIVYDRFTQELKVFENSDQGYRALELSENRCWFPMLELGLGLWLSAYEGIHGHWLRWYGARN